MKKCSFSNLVSMAVVLLSEHSLCSTVVCMKSVFLASAMNLRSMEADTGDIDSVGCTLPEQNPKARGFEQHCCGDPGKVKSDNCNPLHCDSESLLSSFWLILIDVAVRFCWHLCLPGLT